MNLELRSDRSLFTSGCAPAVCVWSSLCVGRNNVILCLFMSIIATRIPVKCSLSDWQLGCKNDFQLMYIAYFLWRQTLQHFEFCWTPHKWLEKAPKARHPLCWVLIRNYHFQPMIVSRSMVRFLVVFLPNPGTTSTWRVERVCLREIIHEKCAGIPQRAWNRARLFHPFGLAPTCLFRTWVSEQLVVCVVNEVKSKSK